LVGYRSSSGRTMLRNGPELLRKEGVELTKTDPVEEAWWYAGHGECAAAAIWREAWKTTIFNSVLQPLFPFGVEAGGGVPGLSLCDGGAQPFVQLDAYALHLHLAVLLVFVHVVRVDLCLENLHLLHLGGLRLHRPGLSEGWLNPVLDTVACCIPDRNPLLGFVSLLCPDGPLFQRKKRK
jgi:hypothetical protein